MDPFGVDYSKFENINKFMNRIKETNWYKSEGSDYLNFCEMFSKDLKEKGLI